MSRRLRRLSFPFDGDLVAPGSKSVANRAIVAAALAEGSTRVLNATPCDDVRHLVAGLRGLGFDLEWVDRRRGDLRVRGGLPQGGGEAELFCGNAGTGLRFLVSVAALVPGAWRIVGDAHMARRPHGPLLEAWRSLGLTIESHEGRTPITVHGGGVTGGIVRLDAAVSSQYLTSLLLVASRLPRGLAIELSGTLASAEYVELTSQVLSRFGVVVSQEAGRFAVAPSPGVSPEELVIEGDWSAVGAFTTLAALSGSRVHPQGVDPDSLQADRGLATTLDSLRGDGDRRIDLSASPDQALNVAVAAACRDGATELVGLANLRHKECDRIAVVVRELRRLGAEAQEGADGLQVRGPTAWRRGRVDPEGDHRVAMAFAVLGALGVDLAIDDPGCVSKSYPGFFEDLEQVTRRPRCLALVGARASGKSALARALGEALGWPELDTDRIFERRHGAIADRVAREGWPAFRRREEEIAQECLLPERVVALGGGAVVTAGVRHCLERALTIWIDEDPDIRRARFTAGDDRRPSLTGASPEEEIAAVDRERLPWYSTVADLRLPPGETLEQRVARVVAFLKGLSRGEGLVIGTH